MKQMAGKKPWSKTKSRIEALFDPKLDLAIHTTSYTHATNHDTYEVPRHWITLNKEVVWDFPGPFLTRRDNPAAPGIRYELDPYWRGAGNPSWPAHVLRQYLDCPAGELLDPPSRRRSLGLGQHAARRRPPPRPAPADRLGAQP